MSTQKEQCQVCGAERPRASLVRKLMPFQLPAAENYLLYSSYNSDFWAVSTYSDGGEVSMGCYADRYRPRVAEGSTTEARGSQTWSGSASGTAASGVLRSTTATDISGLTNVCFSLYIGPYHAQADQTIKAVEMGFCDASGTSIVAYQSYGSRLGQRLCWFTKPVADIDSGVTTSAAYVYAKIDILNLATGADFWTDHMCLEDSTQPSQCRPVTTGAAVVRTGNTDVWRVPILCPECANEKILKPSERYGNFRMADWVEIQDRVEDL